MSSRRIIGRKWHFANVKAGSADVVDTNTGKKLGRVVSYETGRGRIRWTAMLKMGRANRPIGTRQSRFDAAALVSTTSRR